MKISKLKPALSYIPEISIFVIAISWIVSDFFMGITSAVNYFLFGVIVFLGVMIKWKIKAFVISFAVLLGIGSLFMLLAVLSEFREFPQGDSEGLKLLLTGSSIFIGTLVISVWMPQKYFSPTKKLD
jgi:hypothetical protein